MRRNWTLILGCSAFLLVGIVATLVGASIQTATYRAVVASCVGGVCGFFFDYLAANVAPRRGGSASGPSSGPAGNRPEADPGDDALAEEAP